MWKVRFDSLDKMNDNVNSYLILSFRFYNLRHRSAWLVYVDAEVFHASLNENE